MGIGKEITSDILSDWIVEYKTKCFPEDLEEPNHKPTKCFIKDEKKVCSVFKDFGWKPIKLNLKPGTVDIKKQSTKEVLLEKIPFDFVKTKEQILKQSDCKHEITSYMKKSDIVGHPLAKGLMTNGDDGINIVTELKDGMNSSKTFGVFGGEEISSSKLSTEIDEDTDDKIWKDTKTLRTILQDVEFPKKEKWNSREAKYYYISANECFIKARIYYKALFINDVVAFHPDKFRGSAYWKFPIKYLFQYNDDAPDNAVLLHQDIEMKFYTNISVSMENKKSWCSSDHLASHSHHSNMENKEVVHPSNWKNIEQVAKTNAILLRRGTP